MITYRKMGWEDIPSGLALCRSARWNQVERDWQFFLKNNIEGQRVAVDDEGKVRGTVATIRYGRHFSWISMVLVDPLWRRQGVGTQLLRESFEILKVEETIKLDATPEGRKVYQGLGFVDEYSLSRMFCPAVIPMKSSGDDIRPLNEKDWPKVLDMDGDVFGADRHLLLVWMGKGAPALALIAEDNNQIKGYCLGRLGHHFTHIGPVVAETVDVAIRLVGSALRQVEGRPVIMDTMRHSPEWLEWLSAIGFTEQRPFIRMYKGSNSFPGIPVRQWAIAGPEFG